MKGVRIIFPAFHVVLLASQVASLASLASQGEVMGFLSASQFLLSLRKINFVTKGVSKRETKTQSFHPCSLVLNSNIRSEQQNTEKKDSVKVKPVSATIEESQRMLKHHERLFKNFNAEVENESLQGHKHKGLGYELLAKEFDPNGGHLLINTGCTEDENSFVGYESIVNFFSKWQVAEDCTRIEFNEPVYSTNSYVVSFVTNWTNRAKMHGIQRGYVVCKFSHNPYLDNQEFFHNQILEYSIFLNTDDYMRYLFMEDYANYSESTKFLNF
jgi:hypothetical protein